MNKVLLFLFLSSMVWYSQARGEVDNFSGLVFYEYSYLLEKDAKSNEFEFRRVYFTHNRVLNDAMTYKFQADVGRTGDDDRLTLYLKNAKVDWKTGLGTIIVGLQGMNVFNVQEKTWGYRFIEKSAMDQRGFASSADLGIGYARSLHANLFFSTLVTNGRGYKHSENDAYKKISSQLVYGPKDLSRKDGFNAGVVLTFEPYDHENSDMITRENRTVTALFAGIHKSRLRAGVEYDFLKDSGMGIDKSIISLYATIALRAHLNAYIRADQWDPNMNLDDDGETYLIAGLDYSAGKGFYIAPNVRIIQPQVGDATKVLNVNFQIKF